MFAISKQLKFVLKEYSITVYNIQNGVTIATVPF